jgi:hypothetical protein
MQHSRRALHLPLRKILQFSMRLALLIVVPDIVHTLEPRQTHEIEARVAWVVDGFAGCDFKDVRGTILPKSLTLHPYFLENE